MGVIVHVSMVGITIDEDGLVLKVNDNVLLWLSQTKWHKNQWHDYTSYKSSKMKPLSAIKASGTTLSGL